MKILLCGCKGVGKDIAGSFLLNKFGGQIFRFAKPLYDMMYACQDKMGIPRHKDRKFLTTVGDYFRDIDPEIFIKYCFNDVKIMNSTNSIIVDGRYSNELNTGVLEGFYLVKIVSSPENRKLRRPGEDINDSHSSENGYPDDYEFDFTITNNGSLEDFYKELTKMVS